MEIDALEILPLGAGCEVGRSCILIKLFNKSIMFDCGIHPAHSGIGALPIFDAVDVTQVDLCLITHFHLDHCGAVPYFVSHTGFKGRVLMTEATRAICKLLWQDYARYSKLNASVVAEEEDTMDTTFTDTWRRILYNNEDVENTLKKCEIINFRQTIVIDNIKITCYEAGHVLGACMFLVEVGGIRVLYTGDYSTEIDRHVSSAVVPNIVDGLHVLICESTFGTRVHDPRDVRENRLISAVKNVINNHGKVLLPTFVLGRAQELLLILNEYWTNHPELHNIPIYYVSSVTNKSLLIFESFISHSGDHIRRLVDKGCNPFDMPFIANIHTASDIKELLDSDKSCVVLAAPGMLQSGVSRTLFEAWAHDSRNGIIITGYAVRGTTVDQLKQGKTIVNSKSTLIHVQANVEYIPFSAHSDFNQTFSFIKTLNVPNVVLVHGERNEALRLRNKLKFLLPNLAAFAPEILQKLVIKFRNLRTVEITGSLAEEVLNSQNLNEFECLLIEDKISGKIVLVNQSDIDDYTKDINLYKITQTQFIQYHNNLLHLKSNLCKIYDDLEILDFNNINYMRVCSRVIVVESVYEGNKGFSIKWLTCPVADMVADSVVLICVQITRNPTYYNALLCYDNHQLHINNNFLSKLKILLSEKYGPIREEEIEVEKYPQFLSCLNKKINCEEPEELTEEETDEEIEIDTNFNQNQELKKIFLFEVECYLRNNNKKYLYDIPVVIDLSDYKVICSVNKIKQYISNIINELKTYIDPIPIF